jgi:hypothetical protein
VPVYKTRSAKMALSTDDHVGVDRVPKTPVTDVVTETIAVGGISPGTASDE